MNATIFLLALVSVALNAFAQISLKKTMLAVSVSGLGAKPVIFSLFLSIGTNWWFLLGMSCYAISIGLWMLVLSKVEVSLAYPLLSIGYVIAAAIGYFYLGESLNNWRILGIAVICLGIFIISQSA